MKNSRISNQIGSRSEVNWIVKRVSSSIIFWRVCVVFLLSVVCWKVRRVQRSRAVGEREISGEDGVDQLALTGINRTKPPWTCSRCVCTSAVLVKLFTSSITLSLKRKPVSCFPRLKVRIKRTFRTSLKPPNPTCETHNPVKPSYRIQQLNQSIPDFPSIPTWVLPDTLTSPAGR